MKGQGMDLNEYYDNQEAAIMDNEDLTEDQKTSELNYLRDECMEEADREAG